jgi:hypothetical protein
MIEVPTMPSAEVEGSGYAQPTHAPTSTQAVLDFESDAPLVCNRDQSGDTTCEACQ